MSRSERAAPSLDRVRIATTVAPRAIRSIRAGHPWVYDHSIRTQKSSPRAGDLAIIFDDRDRFLAVGLADPHSPIAVRILAHGQSTKIDPAFFARRIDEAIDRRVSLVEDPQTTGYRLVNGENDGLPGFIADRYGDVIVVKLYTAAWRPHLESLLDPLEARCAPSAMVLRASRAVQAIWALAPEASARPGAWTEGSILRGDLPQATVPFLENGLTFHADVVAGNKTGHFLDQRDNRQAVREMASGRSVLDVFSSTGGFSVYAAAGGAGSVTSIDIARGAMAAAAANIAANTPPINCPHQPIVGDAFAAMDHLAEGRQTFDIVVVDPPSFAPKKADIERARSSYRRLTRRAIDLLAPGGTIVQASCSARISEEMFVADVSAELDNSPRSFQPITVTGHPIDHPVSFAEGRYLKAVFATAT